MSRWFKIKYKNEEPRFYNSDQFVSVEDSLDSMRIGLSNKGDLIIEDKLIRRQILKFLEWNSIEIAYPIIEEKK